MPTYAYACADCGHAFDIVQSFSDDSLTVCPQCQGRLRKVFNAVGVVFKGSGFYRTDSRAAAKGGSGAGASASSPSSPAKTPSGSSAATTSSGSQPAAKTSAATSGGAGAVA